MTLSIRLLDVYVRLYDAYGPQRWWPGETPFEVIVGAILTQSAAWTNVEKAIANLKAVEALSPAGLARLSDEGIEVETCPEPDAALFDRMIPDAAVLWHVIEPVSAGVIARAGNLRLIQKIGVGVNTIDLEAAKAAGIAVCNMPGTNSRAVAEVTLLLMLAVLRRHARLDAATRQVVSEIRKVQSLAVTRSGVFGFHWGGDPNIAGLANSQYRLEQDGIAGCAWPAPTDTLATNADVITDWADLAGPYPGVTITTVRDKNNVLLGGAIFDALGGSMNPCTAAAFPLTITLMDAAGTTRTIEVRSAGSVRIQ